MSKIDQNCPCLCLVKEKQGVYTYNRIIGYEGTSLVGGAFCYGVKHEQSKCTWNRI